MRRLPAALLELINFHEDDHFARSRDNFPRSRKIYQELGIGEHRTTISSEWLASAFWENVEFYDRFDDIYCEWEETFARRVR